MSYWSKRRNTETVTKVVVVKAEERELNSFLAKISKAKSELAGIKAEIESAAEQASSILESAEETARSVRDSAERYARGVESKANKTASDRKNDLDKRERSLNSRQEFLSGWNADHEEQKKNLEDKKSDLDKIANDHAIFNEKLKARDDELREWAHEIAEQESKNEIIRDRLNDELKAAEQLRIDRGVAFNKAYELEKEAINTLKDAKDESAKLELLRGKTRAEVADLVAERDKLAMEVASNKAELKGLKEEAVVASKTLSSLGKRQGELDDRERNIENMERESRRRLREVGYVEDDLRVREKELKSRERDKGAKRRT
jgi:chromosome segregation ATPase